VRQLGDDMCSSTGIFRLWPAVVTGACSTVLARSQPSFKMPIYAFAHHGKQKMWWTKSLVGKSPSSRPQSSIGTPSPTKIIRPGSRADLQDDEDAPTKRPPNFLHQPSIAVGADFVAGCVPKFERNHRLQEVVNSRDNIRTAAGPMPLLSALVEGAWIQRKPAELVTRQETQTERMQAAVDAKSKTSMKDVISSKFVDINFSGSDRAAANTEYMKQAAKFKLQNKLGVAALSQVVSEHRQAALSVQAKMDSLFQDSRHSLPAAEGPAPVPSTPNLMTRRLPHSPGIAAAASAAPRCSTPLHHTPSKGKASPLPNWDQEELKHWQSPMKRVNASEHARLDSNFIAVAAQAAQEAPSARRSLVQYVRPMTSVPSGKRMGYQQAQAANLRGAKLRGEDDSIDLVAHGASKAAEERNAAYDFQHPPQYFHTEKPLKGREGIYIPASLTKLTALDYERAHHLLKLLRDKFQCQRVSLRKAFALLNSERNGGDSSEEQAGVTPAEFMAFLRSKNLASVIPVHDAMIIFAIADKDGSGCIGYDEFAKFLWDEASFNSVMREAFPVRPRPVVRPLTPSLENMSVRQICQLVRDKVDNRLQKQPHALMRWFLQHDKSGSGKATASVLKEVLVSIGLEARNADIRAVCDFFCTDGSGLMDYTKFLDACCTVDVNYSAKGPGVCIFGTMDPRRDLVPAKTRSQKKDDLPKK
jgi:Ca2+-binding EF-hand superfamily protein